MRHFQQSMSIINLLIAENRSNNMKTTNAKRKRIQLKNKIIYCTKSKEKNLTQQDFVKIKVEKKQTKNIKTKVNRRRTININTDAMKQQILNTKKKIGKNHTINTKISDKSDSCESLINLIEPVTYEQPVKISSDKKRKNWSEFLMEKKKNRRSRITGNQPPLKVYTECFNMTSNDMFHEINFILLHKSNIIEVSDLLRFSLSPVIKIIHHTHAYDYNHISPTWIDNNILQPRDCSIKENNVHNLKQIIYKNKNKKNSDKNYKLNIFNLILLQCWYYNINTQPLFSKVNKSKKAKISSIHETYSKKNIMKKVSLLRELFSKISETKKKKFLHESNLYMTEKVPFSSKIYFLITEIEKIQSSQKSNSKMTDMIKTSKIYSIMFKMRLLLSSHKIYFKIIYMGEALRLPKTYPEMTAKFRLSLPITHFKNNKKKLELFLNELYSEIAKTEQELPANKLNCKAEKSLFTYSNLTKFIDALWYSPKTFFSYTLINGKYCLKIYTKMILVNLSNLRKLYSRISLKKKLNSPKTYFRVIVHNKLFLLKKFSKKNIRDQQNLSKINSYFFFQGTLLLLQMYLNETIQDKQSILKFYSEVKSKLCMYITYSEVNLKELQSIAKKYSEMNLKKHQSISKKYSEEYPSLPNKYFKDTVKEKVFLPDTRLENPVEKELLKLNKYSEVPIKNGLTLPKANLDVSIKNIISLPNTLSKVTIEKKCIKNISNINSEMVVMKKKESLKLNPQQITTDEPTISILDEANETTTSQITPQKKEFMVGLGLLSSVLSEKKNVKSILPKKNKTRTIKVNNKVNEENTERSNHGKSSSEKMKCSSLSKNPNSKKVGQKHTTNPILISAKKPLELLLHKDHSCMPECSSCDRKFDLLETPFHLAQIKNPDKQKACLENATHLIGSNSCLCVGCYQAIEKRTSIKNLKKRACIVMNCEQTVSRDFNSKWMNTLKSILLINKFNFRVQTNEEEAMHKIPVCNAHYDQILLITQCQLCGNQTIQKFQLNKSLVHEYQSILDEDEIPTVIKYGFLICKPCHIYLLLRRDKTTKISLELEKHCDTTKIRIINHYRLKMKELERMKLAKCEIKKAEENNQLLTVKSLPMKKSNIFTADSTILLKPANNNNKPLMTSRTMFKVPVVEKTMSTVLKKKTEKLSALTFKQKTQLKLSSLIKSTTVATSIQPSTTVINTKIGTAPLVVTRTMVKVPVKKKPMSMVSTSAAKNLSTLGFNQITQPKFIDKHPSVPRTKKRVANQLTITTKCGKRSIPVVHKLTIPDFTIPVEKPTTRVDKSMISAKKPMVPVDKPASSTDRSMIPVDKPMSYIDRQTALIEKPTVPDDKPTTQNDKSMTPIEKLTTLAHKPMIPIDRSITQVNKSITSFNKPKILNNKPTIPVDKPISPIDTQVTLIEKPIISDDKPTTQVVKSMTPIEKLTTLAHKPMIPIDKSMIQIYKSKTSFDEPKNPNDKPMIADHKPKSVFTPVLKSFFTSKLFLPKKYTKTSDLVTPIEIPTVVQTDQSIKNTLNLRSTSPHTEFPKLSRQQPRPSKLSSATPEIIQLYKNLKITYPSGIELINHLLKLETCRNLGYITVENNKTIHHQRMSCTTAVPPHTINRLSEPKANQTLSRIDDYNNDLTDNDYLNNKCVLSEDVKNSDSLFIPVKTTSKSFSKPKHESISPQNVVHKSSQHHDSGDSKKQDIALCTNSIYMPVITGTKCPSIPITTTTITTTTTETLANTVSTMSPIFSTVVEAITTSDEALTIIETASNTSTLITAAADSTTTIMDTEISANIIPDTITITSDITSTFNDNTSIAVEESTTLTMITTKASTTTNTTAAVSSKNDTDSITAITTTIIDNTTAEKINSESPTITTEFPTSTITATDAFTTISVTADISDITTTTSTISTITNTATIICNASQFTYNENTVDKLVPTNSTESIINDISNIPTPISSDIVRASAAELIPSSLSKVKQISAICKPIHTCKLINIQRLNTIILKSAINNESIVWKIDD